uniref:hypothetical protein n=1 Tax=Klebsiella pneumoniae TaxID=573 RepID=UPI003F6DA8B8
QTETEATGAPQKHHYTLNQQVGSITQVVRILIFGKPKRYISFIIIALRVKVIGSTNLILL